MLKAIHKHTRFHGAKYHQTWKDQWHLVIFSDEKKISLDGSDSLAFYWHDMRKEEKIFSKKQNDEGLLIVLGGFGCGDKLNVAFPSDRMSAIDYQELLEAHLLPIAERIGGLS